MVPGLAVTALWSWWTAGARPFGATAYAAVGVPACVLVVAVVALGVAPARIRRASACFGSRARAVPSRVRVAWLVWLGAVVGLEAAALALGGRSRTLPTLSTALDHLLASQASRAVLVAGWLACGGVGLARLADASRGHLR